MGLYCTKVQKGAIIFTTTHIVSVWMTLVFMFFSFGALYEAPWALRLMSKRPLWAFLGPDCTLPAPDSVSRAWYCQAWYHCCRSATCLGTCRSIQKPGPQYGSQVVGPLLYVHPLRRPSQFLETSIQPESPGTRSAPCKSTCRLPTSRGSWPKRRPARRSQRQSR